MSLLLYLFGSGLIFWLGAALVLSGYCGRLFASQRWLDRVSVYALDLGLIFIALSAAPLPYAAYAALLSITILWLTTEKSLRPLWNRRRWTIRSCFVVAWLLALAWELPYQFLPTTIASGAGVYVIGDSITAGLGDKVVPWPELLAERRKLRISSRARAGATTAQAIVQAESLPDDAGTVIVEIGGNDMLGGKAVAEFERDLDALLGLVRQKSHQVLLFELPLPPLHNEYGRVQREQAAKHGVALIPKRVLMGVLSAGDATEDSVHLTQAGHRRLAELVSTMIQ